MNINPNICRPGDPDCVPAAPVINSPTLLEREAAILRSIASGNNACGTLMTAGGVLNEAFIRQAVRPTLIVYEQEAAHLRNDNTTLRADNNELCWFLNFFSANHPHLLEQARRERAAIVGKN